MGFLKKLLTDKYYDVNTEEKTINMLLKLGFSEEKVYEEKKYWERIRGSEKNIDYETQKKVEDIFKKFGIENTKPINNKYENKIRCSECLKLNDNDNLYCVHCSHKLQDISKNDSTYKEYCPICKDIIDKDMNYCGKYGHEIKRDIKERICPICGKWNSNERYCINCGHDIYNNVKMYKFAHKKCPNCNSQYSYVANYCEDCGSKLIKK